MKKVILAAALIALLAGQAQADPDPWTLSYAQSGAFGQGYAYFDTTISAAAGGDSIAFGFWADHVVIMQGTRADSGWVTVTLATNTAKNMDSGIRTGLDKVASSGVRLYMYNFGEFIPPLNFQFEGHRSFTGVKIVPSAASKNVIVRAWRMP